MGFWLPHSGWGAVESLITATKGQTHGQHGHMQAVEDEQYALFDCPL